MRAIPSGYDKQQYLTERMLATARDGVQIPVSLVRRKDTPVDASAPLYLYGYGAYGYAISPSFSTAQLSLLDRGFIYAIAHIRGGDDLGYHWYEAGKLEKRVNTFNDFVDVARHLIEAGYVAQGRIAIAGGSAGGELMGAVLNQAPELWGAVAAHVPFVDVLNTMLDDTLPLTPTEWPEWGNPIEDKEAFELIRSYSPYDQLTARAYPPILVTAGLNDPRGYLLGARQVRRQASFAEDRRQPLIAEDQYGRRTWRQVGALHVALRSGRGIRLHALVAGSGRLNCTERLGTRASRPRRGQDALVPRRSVPVRAAVNAVHSVRGWRGVSRRSRSRWCWRFPR